MQGQRPYEKRIRIDSTSANPEIGKKKDASLVSAD